MAIEVFKAEDINAIAKENRRFHYIKEADPLYMDFQRGDATREEWEAKVQEIKDRFPYVTEDKLIDVYYAPESEESEQQQQVNPEQEGM